MILAIETSCDDSAVALLDMEGNVILNEISSQTAFHQKFGGIVPEIASRKHLTTLPLLLREVLEKAKKLEEEQGEKQGKIQAVAVTYAPGLIGSVLVGLSYAKAVAWSLGVPLIPVDHLEGHLVAPLLDEPELTFPYVSLIASGGHTHLVLAKAFGDYELLGKTMDDAVGEAYDKVAKMVGFIYPGGPIIDQVAADFEGKPSIPFPIPLKGKKTFNFSFSGLKTAVKNEAISQQLYVEKKCLIDYAEFQQQPEDEKKQGIKNIFASFQLTVEKIISQRIDQAILKTGVKSVTLTGGVAANQGLQKALALLCKKRGVNFYAPSKKNCTDNAAMIGLVGLKKFKQNPEGFSDYLNLNASSKSPMGLMEPTETVV